VLKHKEGNTNLTIFFRKNVLQIIDSVDSYKNSGKQKSNFARTPITKSIRKISTPVQRNIQRSQVKQIFG
jgi:hypothetical protein